MTKRREYKPIDWDLVAEMCRIHCTKEEILGVINSSNSMERISESHFDRQIRRELKLTFEEYFKIHSANGCRSLRREQWATALGLKRKRTMILKEKTKLKDGTIVEKQFAQEVDYYPKPNEKMLIWLGQQVLKQSNRFSEPGSNDQVKLPIGTVKIEVMNAPAASGEFKYDQNIDTIQADESSRNQDASGPVAVDEFE